jgi:hypothetical protein
LSDRREAVKKAFVEEAKFAAKHTDALKERARKQGDRP